MEDREKRGILLLEDQRTRLPITLDRGDINFTDTRTSSLPRRQRGGGDVHLEPSPWSRTLTTSEVENSATVEPDGPKKNRGGSGVTLSFRTPEMGCEGR